MACSLVEANQKPVPRLVHAAGGIYAGRQWDQCACGRSHWHLNGGGIRVAKHVNQKGDVCEVVPAVECA